MNCAKEAASVDSKTRAINWIFATFRERLLSGFMWNLLSAIAMQGSTLISSIAVAQLLGLVYFGAYSILTATMMTVANVAQGSAGLVATKFIGENLAGNLAHVASVLRLCRLFTLVVGAVAGLAVFVFAHVLAAEVLDQPELEPALRIVALGVFFQVSGSYQFGALQGFGAFKKLSQGGVIVGLAQILFTSVGAWMAEVEGALIGFVLCSTLRLGVFALILHQVRREYAIPNHTELDRTEVKSILRFALPASLAGFVTVPCLWFVTVLVTRLPNGLALVAILSVAHQIRAAVLQLPALLNAVSFSVLSRLKGAGEATGFRGVFWTSLWLNQIFAILVVGALCAGAGSVLSLYGQDFLAGRWVLFLLLTSVLPELLAASVYQLIQSAGRMWHSLFMIAMPRDIIYLTLAAFFVPVYGVLAAAAAYLAAQTIGLAATLLTARLHAVKPIS